jgi:GWxTD domain-containing protein
VELLDQSGVSKARDVDRVELGTNNAERVLDKKEWYQTIVPLEVPPGKYSVMFESDDLESKRTHLDKNTIVVVDRPRADSLQVSSLIFVRDTSNGVMPSSLHPHTFGGNAEFNIPCNVYFEVRSPSPSDSMVAVRYSVVEAEGPREKSDQGDHVTEASPIVVRNVDVQPGRDGDQPMYTVRHDVSMHDLGVFVPLPIGSLPLRHYVLTMTIAVGRHQKRIEKHFQMVWPDMPSSLRNVDYALNALVYITKGSELDSLRRGDWDTRRNHLEDYWKKKGISAGRPYVDIMSQYYLRVDYASRTFGTLRQPDGFKTDRGRIFVLYGPPSSTERKLNPAAGFQEVWIYDRLNKKFVFADDNRSGDYILVSTKEL